MKKITNALVECLYYKRGREYKKKCVKIFRSSTDVEAKWSGKNTCGRRTVVNYSIIGYMTYLGDDCYLPYSYVGKFCSIGDRVKIIAGKHPTSQFVSTHPAFYSTEYLHTFVNKQKFVEHNYCTETDKIKISIGNDVWIGSDARIMEGVKIGNGAIVGAGALVVKDVEPYTIVGGVPAKEIKKRFTPQQISKLESIKWWDKELSEIIKESDCFDDVDLYILNNDERN